MEDSSTIFVKYLGRMRLPSAVTSASCVRALEQLAKTSTEDDAFEGSKSMEMTVSCARGALILTGPEGEMRHSLVQIACASTKGPLLCYALAIPIRHERPEEGQAKTFTFTAHAFEVDLQDACKHELLHALTPISFPVEID